MPARPAAGGRAAVMTLDDGPATDVALVGRKAANLARARRLGLPVLPGFVVTTEDTPAIARDGVEARRAVLEAVWAAASALATEIVVRSSSSAEDGEESSMAGRFASVLGVRTWPAFTAAVAEVVASGAAVGGAGAGGGHMAVLVQPQIHPAWGGVWFGVDPVTGERDRVVVAAVRGGPDALVSGSATGARYTLSRRGRLLQADEPDPAVELPARPLRAVDHLGRRAGLAFGGPQDVEWAVTAEGSV
ncbi:MAG: PEP/pyruvate-binding domain-containing protein, partial [Acidimicrobiales bacterium]